MSEIIHIPNEVLTSPAKTVVNFDKKLKILIADMSKTLIATRRPKGVGLAAPQIAVPYRVFITRPSAKAEIRAFMNPEILAFSDVTTNKKDAEEEDDKKLEGCLSIPDIWGHVDRSPTVTLRFQDLDGLVHEEVFSGFMATIVQHETDHTNGILFSQRVIEQHQKFYHSTYDEKGKEILEEIQLG